MLPGIELHHESLDGRGYPYGLKGDQIPLLARVIAVADTFDALTTNRPYQRAYEPPEALRIIQNLVGKRLDPEAVAALVCGLCPWRDQGSQTRTRSGRASAGSRPNPCSNHNACERDHGDTRPNCLARAVRRRSQGRGGRHIPFSFAKRPSRKHALLRLAI